MFSIREVVKLKGKLYILPVVLSEVTKIPIEKIGAQDARILIIDQLRNWQPN